MLRLFVLSEVLQNNPQMTQEEVELILTGSLDDIDAYIARTFGLDQLGQPYTALTYLCANSTWQVQDGYTYGDQIDWMGNGIDNSDLVALYTQFPPRELTDEEIEEINRIATRSKCFSKLSNTGFQYAVMNKWRLHAIFDCLTTPAKEQHKRT
ncbi:hypothetical protein O9853_25290 [Vibrio lentus]|nr:hypothetical protein [Vibrio lentus]